MALNNGVRGFSRIQGVSMKQDKDTKIREALAKKYACYVLITCNEPGEDGDMQVEMTYEGDPTLAAYLLQGAQSFMDQQEEEFQEMS